MSIREVKAFREELAKVGTKEIKAQALAILRAKGMDVKLSDFTVREARNLIVENKFLNK